LRDISRYEWSSFCSDAPADAQFGSISVDYSDLAASFIVSAGDAVRAEVQTDDDQQYPALLGRATSGVGSRRPSTRR
jgi:hypothetical protein